MRLPIARTAYIWNWFKLASSLAISVSLHVITNVKDQEPNVLKQK